MTLLDVMSIVDENKNVRVLRGGKTVAEYNGRDDIDEEFNDCEVLRVTAERDGVHIEIAENIRYLADMDCDELVELMNNDTAVFCELKGIADEAITEWEEIWVDMRKSPKGVHWEIGDRGEGVWVDRGRLTYDEELAVVDWLEQMHKDYYFGYSNHDKDGDNGIRWFNKCATQLRRYIRALQDGASGKDEDFCDKAVTGLFEEVCDSLFEYCKAINEQFYDNGYLADALLSCELLDGYYLEGGHVYCGAKGYRKVA